MIKPFIIGISGGSGSGKTQIVERLKKLHGDLILIINQDHYYKDLSHLSISQRHAQNFDTPDSLDYPLLLSQIQALGMGKSVERPCYQFATHTREKGTVTLQPHPVVILDGIFSLCYPDICHLLHLKIYVDVDDDLRLSRRIHRDIVDRGRSVESVLTQYTETVRPMHKKYIEPCKAHADFILAWEKENLQAIHMLSSLISSHQAVA